MLNPEFMILSLGKSFYKITWVKLKWKLPLWNQGGNFVEKVLILRKNIIRLSKWFIEKLIQVSQVSQVTLVTQMTESGDFGDSDDLGDFKVTQVTLWNLTFRAGQIWYTTEKFDALEFCLECLNCKHNALYLSFTF